MSDETLIVIPTPETLVVVTEVEDLVVVEEAVTILDVTSPGPQGSKGDTGAPGADSTVPGPQGPPGTPGAGFNYIHTQAVPSATWTIAHNLGGYPNVAVVDSSKREVVGQVEYVDTNTIEVTFTNGFSGQAFLS